MKRLRTDNGMEFCGREFNKFYKDEGIANHRTVSHTPQQNGVAERMNRTLGKSMLHALVNRFSSTAIDCKTPYDVWSGTPANYSNLKTFG
jgi:transposase InsO family protein